MAGFELPGDIIIDDMGLKQLPKQSGEYLLEVVMRRYENRSTIMTSYLLSFLESVPEVAAKLKDPNTTDRQFEDVVKDAEPAAVLVLVY